MSSSPAHLKCVASSVCEPMARRNSLTAQHRATPSEVEVARPSSSMMTKLREPALYHAMHYAQHRAVQCIWSVHSAVQVQQDTCALKVPQRLHAFYAGLLLPASQVGGTAVSPTSVLAMSGKCASQS